MWSEQNGEQKREEENVDVVAIYAAHSFRILKKWVRALGYQIILVRQAHKLWIFAFGCIVIQSREKEGPRTLIF